MKRRQRLVFAGCLVLAVVAASALAMSQQDQQQLITQAQSAADSTATAPTAENEVVDEGLLDPLPTSEAEWRKLLTRPAYRVLRRKETERAFSGKYVKTKKAGIYRCGGCGQPLFSSAHKFDSGTGWPSYWQPIAQENIGLRPDNSLFIRRTEVICSRCEGHLGHVFSDGPPPTGLRFCINSVALKFEEKK